MSITFSPNPEAKPVSNFNHRNQSPIDVLLGTETFKQKIAGDVLAQPSDAAIKGSGTKASFDHGFVGGVFDAYSEHLELTLRPEDFWNAILVQFSLYVNANSETLRSKFVNFDGQKELEVRDNVTNIRDIDFEKCTTLMASLVEKNLVSEIRDWILPSFTTTTDSDKVVFSALMMSVTQKYFKYVFGTKCGFPKITLLGTVDDYRNLKDRVEQLTKYDIGDEKLMSKWSGMLIPIIDKLIETAGGTPDLEFWSQAIDHMSSSGSDKIKGWMSVFCVFDSDGKWQGDNFSFWGWCGTEPFYSKYPVINTNKIPCGYVTVPVTLRDNISGIDYPSMIVAGSLMFHESAPNVIAPRLDFFLALVEQSKFVVPKQW